MGEMRCFVISPIGDEGSDVRKQADDVLEFIIREALSPLGCYVERADSISESGLITTQIIERIVSSELVVADLSRHNANVFYELAIRHVTGRPFIHLIDAKEKIPFDVAASRTIQYTLDLPGARRAAEELRRQAKECLENTAKVESPVSVAIDLKALSSSEDPVATALRRIESEISQIQSSVKKLTSESNVITATNAARLIEMFSNPSPRFSWTDENVEALKDLWNSGESASNIAKLLGANRNAVIGKIHRLGLIRRNHSEDDNDDSDTPG